jgi:hypothetical protein
MNQLLEYVASLTSLSMLSNIYEKLRSMTDEDDYIVKTPLLNYIVRLICNTSPTPKSWDDIYKAYVPYLDSDEVETLLKLVTTLKTLYSKTNE